MHDDSRRTRRSPIGSVVVLAAVVLALPGAPRAEEANFRPYLVGSRSAGMGGAFTALADDGAGPYYNPAGIGFVRRSQLSLSGSVYGIASGTLSNALGDGHDFKYSSLQTLPTATAAVFKLGPDHPDRANVVALTVYVPDALIMDGRDKIASAENAFLLSSQSQTVWAGATYSHRRGRFSFGVSGFLLFATDTSQMDLSVLVRITDPATLAQLGCPSFVACATQFGAITARTDSTTYGVIGAVGARWDATDNLRLGLSVYSPELGWGTRRAFVRYAVPSVSDGTTTLPVHVRVENVDGLHASPTLPLRVQAGAAWTSGRFTAAADVMYLAARTVNDDQDRTDQGLNRQVIRNAVVNGSVGVEYVIADRFPLRAGAFTDLSSANEPDPVTVSGAKIHRYGGSLSIGLRTEHTATDLGVMVSGGSGTDLVPNNLDFSSMKAATSSQLFTYFFLGTSYEF